MLSESDEMKKRLVHQIAEDFYSRFESNEEKLERLRLLQKGEVTLPEGLEVEGDFQLPEVGQMHSMLLRGIRGNLGIGNIPPPQESKTRVVFEKDSDEEYYQ